MILVSEIMLISHFSTVLTNFSSSCFKSVAQALPAYVILSGIGDGRSTKIWRDNWIPRGHKLKPIDCTCLWWVHQLIDSQSNPWDETTVRRFFLSM